MKIVKPNGAVMNVVDTTPVVICRNVVNGKANRKVYPALTPSENVNGVIFTSNAMFSRAFVGNISSDTVKEMLSELAEKNCVDLTKYNLKPILTYKQLQLETEPCYLVSTPQVFGEDADNLDSKLDYLTNRRVLPFGPMCGIQNDVFVEDEEDEE